jgi:hypothetical protein
LVLNAFPLIHSGVRFKTFSLQKLNIIYSYGDSAGFAPASLLIPVIMPETKTGANVAVLAAIFQIN